MWAVLAFAKLGDGDRAVELLAMLNPINHSRSADHAARYRVEPYAVAADIYSVEPHVGRGGWTWYTGAAGWMYQAGLEGILGLRRQGDRLVVDPCIPSTWPGLSLVVTVGSSFYAISVTRGRGPGAAGCLLDGASIDWSEGRRYVPLDGKTHTLSINLAGAMN